MSLQARRTQHAVGQGGFHSAAIRVGSKWFRYIYDCGSRAPSKLDPSLKAWGNDDLKYDWLVISSFDIDHFNGVKKLIDKGFTFQQIVLPHMLSKELFEWILLSSFLAGKPTSAIAQAWVSLKEIYGRGAGPVIPFTEGPQNLVTEGGLVDLGEFAKASKAEISTQAIRVRDADWMFRFYSRELKYSDLVKKIFKTPGLTNLRKLIDVATKALNKNEPLTNAEALLTAIQAELDSKEEEDGKPGPSVKKILNKAYCDARDAKEEGFDDYNSASLCMYSGPVPEFSNQMLCKFHLHRNAGGNWLEPRLPELQATRSVGWLGVGDITFHKAHELDDFLDHYNAEMRYVITRMIPHHGAHSNYDVRLSTLRNFVEAAPLDGLLWVAAADPIGGGYRHPDGVVVLACATTGAVWLTSTESGTMLVEEIAAKCCCHDGYYACNCDCDC